MEQESEKTCLSQLMSPYNYQNNSCIQYIPPHKDKLLMIISTVPFFKFTVGCIFIPKMQDSQAISNLSVYLLVHLPYDKPKEVVLDSKTQ